MIKSTVNWFVVREKYGWKSSYTLKEQGLGRTIGTYSAYTTIIFFIIGGNSRCRLSCVVNSFGAKAGARFVASNPAMPGQLVNVIVMGE